MGNTKSEDLNPLHVRLVTWDDDPPVGGQGVYVRELREELLRLGVHVTTLAGRGRFALPYARLTGRPHFDMSIALNRSLRPLRAGEPDVLHLSGGPGGLQLLRNVGIPVVFTAHHTFRQSHSLLRLRRAYGVIEAQGYARAAAVIAVSPSTADSLIAIGVAPEKVVVISPGIRVASVSSKGEERQPGRMLFVGRLEREKGPLDAIAAMDLVAQKVPGARGYIVGGGSMTRRVASNALRTAGRVVYLGKLADEEVACEYRRAQVVLMPSSFEGLGMVALEAMASGAAVVGYDVAGLHDTLRPHGCLVPHGDIAALASSTAKLIMQPAFRHDLVEGALQNVKEERSWERCAAEVLRVYEKVLQT